MKDSFWKSNIFFVLVMLALASAVTLALYVGVFSWLGKYTQHGIEVDVPNVCGMYPPEAEILLESEQLHIQVIDSTYSQKVPLGAIVEQNPQAGAKAKHGRQIYAIVNSRAHKQVSLLELKDMSQRQAEAILRSLGLVVNETLFEPSEFRGLVLDVRQENVSLPVGTRLQEGSAVTLVIGQGKGTEQMYVPSLLGKTVEQAREDLLLTRLVIGALDYAEPQTEHPDETYYIYQQEPAAGKSVVEGSRVDLFLSINPDNQLSAVVDEEDDFF